MALGDVPFCDEHKTWHTVHSIEHMMMDAAKESATLTVDETERLEDARTLAREANRLGEIITGWLYDPDVRIGWKDPELVKRLVQAIQNEGFRVD